MKNLSKSIVLLFVLLVSVSFGQDSDSLEAAVTKLADAFTELEKAIPEETVDAIGKTVIAAEKVAEKAGTNEDLESFVKNLEEMSNTFCEEGKKYEKMSFSEKMKASQKMMIHMTKLSEYNSEAIEKKGKMSKEAQARIDAANKKMERCNKYYGAE